MFKHRFLVVMKHKLLIFPHSLENISISHTISIRKIGCNVNHCRNQNVCSDTDDRQPRQVTYRRLSRHSLSGPCRAVPYSWNKNVKKRTAIPRRHIPLSTSMPSAAPAAMPFKTFRHTVFQLHPIFRSSSTRYIR